MSSCKINLTDLENKAKSATDCEYWTYRGKGLYSRGTEGISLCDENEETSVDDLEYLASVYPKNILTLISCLRDAMSALEKIKEDKWCQNTEMKSYDVRIADVAGNSLNEIKEHVTL